MEDTQEATLVEIQTQGLPIVSWDMGYLLNRVSYTSAQ